MRYFSALCARMYRLGANSRATISSTAIFFSQQSRQYRSSPRGSETSFAPHSAHFDLVTVDLRDISPILLLRDRLLAERRLVHAADVLLDHPARAEAGEHRADRLPDDLQPPAGNAVGVAVVEGGHELLLDEPVDRLRVGPVLRAVVVRIRLPVDEPAVVAGEALGPPAVADREVRRAVDGCLHAAPAAPPPRVGGGGWAGG